MDIRNRCHDQQLERDGSIRLSTNTANKSDIEQASSGRSRSHSNSSSVAVPLVSNSGSTITTTTVGEAVKTTTSTVISKKNDGGGLRLELAARCSPGFWRLHGGEVVW